MPGSVFGARIAVAGGMTMRPLLAVAALAAACAPANSAHTQDPGKADDPAAPEAGQGCFVEDLDMADSSGLVDGPCLFFDDPEWNAADADGTLYGDKVAKTSRFVVMRIEKMSDPLSLEQLRATLRFFIADYLDDPQIIESATAEELDELGENAFFRITYDLKTGKTYRHINIAAGDTPLELVFAEGTVAALASIEDGSVTYCADELMGGASPGGSTESP